MTDTRMAGELDAIAEIAARCKALLQKHIAEGDGVTVTPYATAMNDVALQIGEMLAERRDRIVSQL